MQVSTTSNILYRGSLDIGTKVNLRRIVSGAIALWYVLV